MVANLEWLGCIWAGHFTSGGGRVHGRQASGNTQFMVCSDMLCGMLGR